MLKNNITPKEIVDFLNELLEVDREGISALCASRVGVNQELAGHPSVQVRPDGEWVVNDLDMDNCSYTVAFLGVINGLFGVDEDGWGCIYRSLDDTGLIVEFGIVTDETKGK